MNKQQRLEHDGALDPILFYHQGHDWGVFSNFSHHPVVLPHPWTGVPTFHLTSEHRYQAMKATCHEDYDYVLAAENATESKARGGRFTGIPLRSDWGDKYHDLCYYVMFEVVFAKAIQVPEMADALVDSQDRSLYEDSPTDDIWGWRNRNDYRGRNLLGQALMEVRSLIYGYPSPRPFRV